MRTGCGIKLGQVQEDYETILLLRQYRERLEKAMQARKDATKNHNHVLDHERDVERLPDDGFRRD